MRDEAESAPNMILHTIRLNAAWRSESHEESVAWIRNFGRPTGIDNGERVELVINDLQSGVAIRLNGQPLESSTLQGQSVRCDITDQLEPRNQLILELEAAASDNVNDQNASAETPFNQIQLEIVASTDE